MTSAIVSDTVIETADVASPHQLVTVPRRVRLRHQERRRTYHGAQKREHNITLPVSFYIVGCYKGLSVKRTWDNTAHDIKAVSLCMCFCCANVFAKKAKAVIMSATIFALLIDNLIDMSSTCMVSMIGTFCSRRR